MRTSALFIFLVKKDITKMAVFNITINQEALNQISDKIGNRTVEQLKKIGDDQSLLLKKIALNFLNAVEKNLERIKAIEDTEKKLKQKRHDLNLNTPPKDENIVAEYIRYKDELKQKITIDTSLDNFFKECLIFNDSIVQIITGKKTRVTIVIPTANDAPIIRDYSIQQLLDEKSGVSIIQDVSSGKIPRVVGRLKFDTEKMKNDFNSAIRKDNMISVQELNALNITYNSALFDNYNKYKPYVVWKPLGAEHWFKMKISGGAGDISEGYAYFYYKGANENFNFAKHHLYDNLDTFFRYGVGSVSNLSGLYGGDISTAEYEYAVKSLQASLPGYVQMIQLAKNIINNKIKNATDLKNLALKKQYKDPVNKQGQKGLRNFVTEILESELGQFFND